MNIVTEAEGVDPDALDATAASLARQSLQAWTWTILGSAQPSSSDPRIRTVSASSRAVAIATALAESGGHVALVDAGAELHPTTLEKWAWFLESNPDASAVAGARRGLAAGEPRLIRREYVERSGGIDAAYAMLGGADVGYVPFTGSVWDGDLDDEPHIDVAPTTTPNAWIPDRRPFENRLAKDGPRLLLITPWMLLGGADKVNLDVLERLRAAGWDVSVATTMRASHSLLPWYERHTPDLFPLTHFLDFVDFPRFLAYLIDSRDMDAVLVSNSELGYRLLPYLRSRCPRPAYVDLCHSEAEHWYNGGYPRLSVEYQELLDLTVTASAHLRRWMSGHGANADRIEVCYANVDADQFAPDPDARRGVRARLGVAKDEPLVLFVGRVSEDKQPDVLAATVRRLDERDVPFTLVIAGDGPDLARLRRFFKLHRLTHRVRLPGTVLLEEMPELYAAADVLFVPSRSEGIALVLYEAMAAGLPVVGADVGGQGELVTAETGVLVARGSTAEERDRYADALESLLRDPELRRAMGTAARRRIERDFRIEQMGARFDALLRDAMRLRDESPRPTPPPGLARAVATEAIEIMRPTMTWFAPADHGPLGGRRRAAAVRTYGLMRRAGGPVYRSLVARGVPLSSARDALRRRMMGF